MNSFLQAPTLNTNAPQMKFGQFLMSNAQQGLEFNEQKRQNAFNNAHTNKVFKHNVMNDNRNYGLNVDKFNETKNQNKLTNLHRENVFKHNVSMDNKNYGLNFGKFNYQKEQDVINNNFKQQEINIANSKANAPKTDIEKTLVAAGIDPKSELGQQFQKAMLVKKTLVPTVDGNGNTVMVPVSNFMSGNKDNPSTLNDVVITKKTNDVDSKDAESLNEAIKIANSINYVNSNFNKDFVGQIDGRMNDINSKMGWKTPNGYSEWATHLQSVGNAARNKSFGSALSGFDIEEFAKEFPNVYSGDNDVLPKLQIRKKMLEDSLSNTYRVWVEKYGKERADKFFEGLTNKPYLQTTSTNQSNQISNEMLLNILKVK